MDSLINQSLRDIEIICINDGSKDNSFEILKQHASKNNKIKLMLKKYFIIKYSMMKEKINQRY